MIRQLVCTKFRTIDDNSYLWGQNDPMSTDKQSRVKVNLGKLEQDVRRYANERNVSMNAVICQAVKKFIDHEGR
jgi:hypothetical protein